MLIVSSPILMFAMATGGETQNPAAAQQWRDLVKSPDFFHEMSLLQSLGQDLHERDAVLSRLHRMWATYDDLRRPEIAYLMCQLGDRSGVEEVARAFFAGEYDTGRELEPDGSAAGDNATDGAFRMLILYGTLPHHQKLLAFLKLSEDPLRKGGNLCEILLGLSSSKEGPGLPVGYPREQFPFELVIGCLDYKKKVGTIVFAPGGSVESHMDARQPGSTTASGSMTVQGATGVYEQRGCDYAAQTIQNLTSRDFGHHSSDSLSQRDRAIKTIKKWWNERMKVVE
jgi:hypothetical protein